MRAALFCVLTAMCVGCANNAHHAAPVGAIIDDAAEKLVEIYPPAKTRLSLVASDNFGRDLAAKLRMRGFAVNENMPAQNAGRLAVRYAVATDTDGVLVALYFVGDDLLSRGYVVTPTGDNYVPMSAWSLRQTVTE